MVVIFKKYFLFLTIWGAHHALPGQVTYGQFEDSTPASVPSGPAVLDDGSFLIEEVVVVADSLEPEVEATSSSARHNSRSCAR